MGRFLTGSAIMLTAMLLIAACTSGEDASADEPTTAMAPATTVAPPATVAAPATSITTEATATTVAAPDPSFAAYCEKNVELIEVRGQVYGPPFDEIPEEIEALLNEAALLSEEFSAWMPEEIRDRAEFLNVAFDGAIDAMTEELGWNPYAAMNSEAASAIFSDPEIGVAIEEIMAFNEQHCGPLPTP